MTLKAKLGGFKTIGAVVVGVATVVATVLYAIEFRENQQTVWKVLVSTGKRRAFTFEQTITVGKPKLGFLSA